MTEYKELLENIDIQDWLSDEAIDYKRGSSANLNVRQCPFCGSQNYKVYMRADDGRGVCFAGSCHQQKFNFFSFVREHLGVGNADVFRHLEQYAQRSGFKPATAGQHSPAPVTPDEWNLPRSTPLPGLNGTSTLPYLIERKVLLSTQSLFQLSYCHEGHFNYVNADGKRSRMDFSGRVLIPVHDLDGVARTFQGRDVTGTAEKRYLFPPMLPGTGRFLYGAHLHRGKDHLVIGEGAFDVWAIHQSIDGMADMKGMGAVGSFGLSIGGSDERGDDQLGRLRQLKQNGLKTLTFLWDAEKGALRHALDAGMALRREGFAVRIGLLPPGKDPSECSTEQVRAAIREAVVLSDGTFLRMKLRSPFS